MAVLTLVAALLASVPSFHLVLSDGNFQLEGGTERVAENVAESFSKTGIEVTWSSDPSDPSLPTSNLVKVIVVPRSSEDWGLAPGILAATRRNSGGEALVVVFYKGVERVLGVNQLRSTRSIQGWRPPGRRVVHAVSRVVFHEIFHYFLPGRPHDAEGVFMDHVEGNLLARESFEVSIETRDALVTKLLFADTP